MPTKFNSDQLLKAADRFHVLVRSASAEADSTMVTLAVRPAVNKALAKIQFNAKISKVVQDLANKMANANKELHGNLKVDGVVTNAEAAGGKWKAQAQLKASGSLLDDPSSGPAIKSFITQVNAAVSTAVATELNRLAANLAGDKITANEVEIDTVDINI
jgi:hypothetical protein